jgi:glycosyltransferase involved in cell wall biosynthesis
VGRRDKNKDRTVTPLFSIIVPTYERASFLEEALDSISSQSVREWECIVVDDASREPARAPDDERFRLIRLPTNGGAAVARNAGLVAAVGRYVCFLDDDDRFVGERLAIALRGVEISRATVCWRTGDPTGSSRRILDGDVSDSILDDLTPHLGQVTVERRLAPRFDETYRAVEDVEWWLRLSKTCRLSTIREVGLIFVGDPAVRQKNGLEERIRQSIRLLTNEDAYFAQHPRARAFRWKRIAIMSAAVGDAKLARLAFARSLTAQPSLHTLAHSATSIRRSVRRLEVEVVNETKIDFETSLSRRDNPRP